MSDFINFQSNRRFLPFYNSYRNSLPSNSCFANYIRNDHTQLNVISFYNDRIRVTVTKRAAIVDRWIHNLLLYARCYRIQRLVIGLDIEWLPNFNPGDDHPVATLQLCVGNRCLIFQLLHRDSIPPSLSAFLGCESFTFVGIGVRDDAEKLYLHHGLRVSKTMDLNIVATMVFGNEAFERMGLKRMAMEILRKVMPKPKHITLSQWDAQDLTNEQVEYAAIDAFVSFQLGKYLHDALGSIVSD